PYDGKQVPVYATSRSMDYDSGKNQWFLKVLGRVPVMGICLGHQIISRALGAETFKLCTHNDGIKVTAISCDVNLRTGQAGLYPHLDVLWCNHRSFCLYRHNYSRLWFGH
ncbi:MAG TPA: hypothetical protein EYO82_10400, partial [Gammaproteobacteria bacterium]|nr:hypothetical protein [Gammaproteobacteria bacterium]